MSLPTRTARPRGRLAPRRASVVPMQRRNGPPMAPDDPRTARAGIVYGFVIPAVDPATGLVRRDAAGAPVLRMDYIGQTRQPLVNRTRQHLDEKPWADLVDAGYLPVIIEQGFFTDQQLTDLEVAAIEKFKPRLNHEYNLANPERIEIWRQAEHRWARDDAAGRPRWTPPVKQPREALAVARPAGRPAGTTRAEWRGPDVQVGDAVRALVRSLRALPKPVRAGALVLTVYFGAAAAVAACLAQWSLPALHLRGPMVPQLYGALRTAVDTVAAEAWPVSLLVCAVVLVLARRRR